MKENENTSLLEDNTSYYQKGISLREEDYNSQKKIFSAYQMFLKALKFPDLQKDSSGDKVLLCDIYLGLLDVCYRGRELAEKYALYNFFCCGCESLFVSERELSFYKKHLKDSSNKIIKQIFNDEKIQIDHDKKQLSDNTRLSLGRAYYCKGYSEELEKSFAHAVANYKLAMDWNPNHVGYGAAYKRADAKLNKINITKNYIGYY